jgi:hypothetical protein
MYINGTCHLWFDNRSSESYLQALYEQLDLQNLIETSREIVDKTGKYERIIQIDFCGMAGKTLLLGGDTELKKKINQRFLGLFAELDNLDKLKIRLKTRFVFPYLYSVSSLAFIEAEMSENRATIENKEQNYNDASLYSLTNKDFYASPLFKNQTRSLKRIQHLYNEYFKFRVFPDILNIRFTCLPVNFCLLVINNQMFLDPYTYAKQEGNASLINETPVIAICKLLNKTSYLILEDHLRYLWNHPTTLYYEGATKAYLDKHANNRLENLHEIKEPHEVSYESKAIRLKKIFGTSDNRLNRAKFLVERMFNSMTRRIEVTPEAETIFLAFSFKNGKSMAEDFRICLEEDFGDTLKVIIVDVVNGQEPLYTELTKQMSSATIALMLFTKDIKEGQGKTAKYYSRPNVYWEFGKLHERVEKYGNPLRRIILFHEEGVEVPTDYQDLGRLLLRKKLHFDYQEVIARLFEVSKTLSEPIAEVAIDKYLSRFQDAYDNGKVSTKELPEGKTFNEFKSEIKVRLKNVLHKRFKYKMF